MDGGDSIMTPERSSAAATLLTDEEEECEQEALNQSEELLLRVIGRNGAKVRHG